MEKLYTKSDLAARWGISRQLVNNRSVREADFLEPVQYVGNDSIPLYVESDVVAYEDRKGVSKKGEASEL